MYSSNTRWFNRFLLAGAIFFSLSALSEGSLQSRMEALLVITQVDGKETFATAKSVEPGQVIEYRTVYSNSGVSPISNLSVVGPVPAGTRYLDKSATSSVTHVFEASIDGGSSWHTEPLMRTVTQADGSKTQEVVPPEEYSHVRWKAAEAIARNSRQEYRYRVFVLPTEDNAK